MSYRTILHIAAILLIVVVIHAQELTVTGRRVGQTSEKRSVAPSALAVWLVPVGSDSLEMNAPEQHGRFRLVQKDKQFEPHMLVVPVGTAVEFPNLDPWFHNVFSLFEGKRFDLGLYEAGTSKTVRFDKAGVSYIFCNIHPEMSAVVVAVPTPYYSVSNKRGEVSIANVPPGHYAIHFWSEGATPDELNALTREIDLSGANHSFGAVRVPDHMNHSLAHKNKYGKDYDPPSPTSSIYVR